MLTMARSKLFWIVLVVLVIAGATGGLDWRSDALEHGPRNPGFNKQLNCRFMTLEVESAFSDEQLKVRKVKTIAARLDAQLGSAGPLNEPILLVDSDVGLYKREFCAKPGTSLRADVAAVEKVDSMSCYFMSGPDDDTDDETTAYDDPFKNRGYKMGAANQIAAWCVGVVP